MTQKMIGYWDESWTQRSLQGLTSLALEDDAMRSSDICTTRRMRNIAALICT